MYFDTDKIEPAGYFTTYLKIAADLGPAARVCEIGIWQGESLRMWQSLFPLGKITGVDQVPGLHWPEGTERVVSPQDSPSLPMRLGGENFDLIIDDASHEAGPTRATFDMLWPKVNPGGYYVVEDWYMALLRPDEKFLAVVADFLRLLNARDSECDWVHYKYGLAIAHKRRR
jgi:methyltransferase family protein